MKNWSGFAGLASNILLIAGISFSVAAILQRAPWWAPVGIFLLLLFYGLLRASYEIEVEKKALEQQIETDEQRAAIAAELQRLYREGQSLKAGIIVSDDESPASEWQEEFLNWRENVYQYLYTNVSGGRAEYVDGVSSVSAASISGMKSFATRREKESIILHLDARLNRLTEVLKEY